MTMVATGVPGGKTRVAWQFWRSYPADKFDNDVSQLIKYAHDEPKFDCDIVAILKYKMSYQCHISKWFKLVDTEQQMTTNTYFWNIWTKWGREGQWLRISCLSKIWYHGHVQSMETRVGGADTNNHTMAKKFIS